MTRIHTTLLLLTIVGSSHRTRADGPFQATGFKVGEVTESSAIVWTRLTLRKERNSSDAPKVEIVYEQAAGGKGRNRSVRGVVFPAGLTVADIFEAAPGMDGDVRVAYRMHDTIDWRHTGWHEADGLRDFTCQFTLEDLKPNTRYDMRVETRSVAGTPGQSLDGTFRTAPAKGSSDRVVFTVSTGQGNDDQDRPDGFNIYPEMLKLDPNFFVHTGDIVYYDRLAKTLALARYHWQRMYSWPTNVQFHRQVSSYFIKDDHDTLVDDCWPTMQTPYMHEFTFRQGLQVFREQVPMETHTWRTRRWGRHLQIWMVEGRDFRSSNRDPDGPEKTIWGQAQKDWFKASVTESDATFRVLISPTPIVGPDRDTKRDNHSNSGFQTEGDELRAFIATQDNLVVVCGDRHWQYMSVHPGTGVREYSCGPASDLHANGWNQSDYRKDYHRYLNVVGGFLSATVEPGGARPRMTFRYHDVHGKVNFEDTLSAE
ncbi:MAG: alkaline phosphatase D family protein [Fuerstiella sp.]|nr:alkaline phosphatase D family protein [Fuerstiella sp.]